MLEPKATEKQSMGLYAMMSNLDEALQLKAPQALKECWRSLGKWDGKLSKKQKENGHVFK